MAAYIRPQFSVEQRNFIAMSFERNKHQYTKIQLVQEEFKLLADVTLIKDCYKI